MIEDKILYDVNKDLGIWFEEILSITKSLGNETRLRILSFLLQGKQSFQTLINSTNLKKTALSNHLSILVTNGLIVRADHGVYEITKDGTRFIQALVTTYKQSDHQKEQLKTLKGLKMSNMFIQSFLKKK